jgi:CubicO group peptidase (beta-lactamase class C family)
LATNGRAGCFLPGLVLHERQYRLPIFSYFRSTKPHKKEAMKKILFGLFAVAALAVKAQTPSFMTDSLDSYIAKGLKDWQVPGLSIVVVKDGKVVVQKGYGVKNIATKEPVDENTLFMIASNTKLFTGMALAQLEQQKKLSIDDKITKFFPNYSLYDKAVTQMATVRDLLAHRIGTKTFQGDFTFWNTNLTRQQIMDRMRLLKPSSIFRQDYGYCNSCYLTAGQVVEKITGTTWEQYVTDSMLKPLGMLNSYTVSAGMAQRNNVASPYSTSFTDKLNPVPYDNWDNLGPAASIISNVKDLANWLLFQLDSGRHNGKRIMPFSVLQRTRDINIMTGSRRSSAFPIHFRGYGLGLFGADYNGRQIYWHTGGAAGMVSNVCFVPEERLGIAILTNNDNQNFFECLRYQILDAYLGMPYVNRSQQQLQGFNQGQAEQVQQVAAWKTRTGKTAPALPLAAYAGTYTHPLYGSIGIAQNGNALQVRFNTHPTLAAALTYMDNGEWLLEYNNIEYGIFATKFTVSGKAVKSVEIKANDFVEYDPYTFIKK